jgi:hypothetical protein
LIAVCLKFNPKIRFYRLCLSDTTGIDNNIKTAAADLFVPMTSRQKSFLKTGFAEHGAVPLHGNNVMSALIRNLPGMAYRCKNDPSRTMLCCSGRGYASLILPAVWAEKNSPCCYRKPVLTVP